MEETPGDRQLHQETGSYTRRQAVTQGDRQLHKETGSYTRRQGCKRASTQQQDRYLEQEERCQSPTQWPPAGYWCACFWPNCQKQTPWGPDAPFPSQMRAGSHWAHVTGVKGRLHSPLCHSHMEPHVQWALGSSWCRTMPRPQVARVCRQFLDDEVIDTIDWPKSNLAPGTVCIVYSTMPSSTTDCPGDLHLVDQVL